MPSVKKLPNKPSHISKGNVLEDLGLSRSELIEAKVKSDLWRDLVAHIVPLQLTQRELAKRLCVHQPEISHLLNGKLSKFSVGTLIHYGAKLDLGFEGKFTKSTPRKTAVRTLHANAKHTQRSRSEALAASGE